MKIHTLAVMIGFAIAGSASLRAEPVVEDWPHFLGPHMNATTRESPLLEKWPESGLEVVWEKERGEGYACPIIADGRLYYFHRVDRKETVDCRDPATGELIWSYSYPVEYVDRYGFSAGPRTSAVVDDGRVFISECYEIGGVLLEYDESRKSKPLWKQREFGMHFMMPIVKDGHLFGFAGRNPPDTEFKCVDLERGEVKWTKDYRWAKDGQVEGLFRASLLQAGERFFALGEDGIFMELEISPEGTKEIQRARLFTAREAWTLPSLHKGLLYVVQNTPDAEAGTTRRLICYDLRGN